MNQNLVIENAVIRFKNFSGKEGTYNAAGQRNFCVFLDEDVAEQMASDGWNVKYLTPRDPEESRQAYIQVSLSYEHIPPKVFMISSKGKTALDEESVGVLDWAELDNVDLIIRPYNWSVGGRSGVKAYVKSLYATISEDALDSKYLDVPDSASSASFR